MLTLTNTFAQGFSDGLIFYERFDSLESINQNGGSYRGILIEPSKFGKSVLLDDGDALSFPIKNNFNLDKGTIDFWFKPLWPGNDSKTHYFFNWQKGNASFRIFKYYSKSKDKSYFVFRVDRSDDKWGEVSTFSDEPSIIMQWQPNQWHHVQVFWDFTVPNKYIGLLLDDYTKVTYSDWIFDGLPTIVEIGNRGSNFQANALIDELKIYNYSLLKPGNPESLQNSTCGDNIWQNYETIYNCPQDCQILDENIYPAEDYLFFKSAPFEAIYEGTVPREEDITDKFIFSVAKNEFEPLFFNIYSRKDLYNVKVFFSDFVGSNGLIPRENSEIRVIKNWFQAGTGPQKSSFPVYVPELLLYDDTIEIEDQNWNSQDLPWSPKLGYAFTNIPSYTSKQFVIIIKVLDNIEAGIYSSTVTISPENLPSKSFTIDLEVLPFKLEKPNKEFIIYLRGGLTGTSDDYVGMERLDKQIKDIKDHGFNGVCLYGENNFEAYQQKIQIVKNHSMDGMLIFTPYSIDLKTLLEKNGQEPYFYGVDEPNNNERLKRHIQKSIDIHELGGKVITAITKTYTDRLEDLDDSIYDDCAESSYEPLDFANLSFSPEGIDYFHSLINGTATKDHNQTYYWQIMQEDPRINRHLAGFFLWLTDLDGIFPYVYQHITNNPYDDFDEWHGNYYRDHLVTYPSQEGPVPTIQWEALREGIDDIRYLSTWLKFKNEAEKTDPELAYVSEEIINTILEKYNTYDAWRSIPISQYYQDRLIIIEEIIKLSRSG